MSVGQPGMKGKEGQLYGKSNEKEEKDRRREQAAQGGLKPKAGQCRHVEGASMEIEEENANQHHGTADKSINKILVSCVFFSVTAPNRDKEIHRDKLQFPEKEEQDKV